MIRKLILGTFVTGLVAMGLVVQAGAHLLALPSPPPGLEPSSALNSPTLSRSGSYGVGVRQIAPSDAPIAMSMWYPASPSSDATRLAYSYGISMFGPESSLALATYVGRATPDAPGDPSGGPYPLVILSHGFAISGSSYAWLAEHLVSHGFVVVALRHRETLDPDVLWRSTIERPRDILVLLNYIDTAVQQGDRAAALIDIETVAVIGHSYGGYTALAAAGARLDTSAFETACNGAYETEEPLVFLCDAILPRVGKMADLAGLEMIPSGAWPGVADPRIDAVVSMAGDAALFGHAGLASVDVPVMALGGTADLDSPFPWGTALTYEHVSSSRKVQVALDGAAHMVFAGECTNVRRIMSLVSLGFCSDPVWDPDRAHDLVKHYVAAFLMTELQDDHEASKLLSPTGQEVPGTTYRAKGY